MVKMNEDKAAMYLVAIVGVVAAVGIIVLLMGAGIGSSSDVSGQAIKMTGIKKPTISTGTTAENCPCGLCTGGYGTECCKC